MNIHETLRALFSNVARIPCIVASSDSPTRKYVNKYPRDLRTWNSSRNSTETFARRFTAHLRALSQFYNTKISRFNLLVVS